MCGAGTHTGGAGIAHSDRDVAEFLRSAGPPEDERLLDDPARVERAGGRAHVHDAA
ncbi:hypothetical protein ACH4VX_26995 [Streptomyces sp. NPDC020731]|uniref:hypothetical protein n=1 Tax=Streptomyces sp. NPDC020731 TaxID=3365085 RepID=UPI0037AD6C7C